MSTAACAHKAVGRDVRGTRPSALKVVEPAESPAKEGLLQKKKDANFFSLLLFFLGRQHVHPTKHC